MAIANQTRIGFEFFWLRPEGPITQYVRTLVLKTIEGMVFGTRVLKHWAIGPFGTFKADYKSIMLEMIEACIVVDGLF